MATSTFVPVTGDRNDMTLGDLTPSDDFVSSTISFMTSGGATAKVDFKGAPVSAIYSYWTEEDAEDGAGWYLEADTDATVNQNDVNLPFGTGFLVFRDASEASATVTYAGAVSTDPVTKSFATAGYNICGNCSPVNLTLGDVTVSDDFVSSTISFMTSGGATAKVDFKGSPVSAIYSYWTEEDAEDGAGWYLEADTDATVNQNDVQLAAGAGFLVFRDAAEGSATLTIPAAL